VETVSHFTMNSVLMTRLAMTLHVWIPVDQHFVVEDPAVTQQPTAEVWITRQNAPVLQELKENLEQEECAAMYLTGDQVEWPVETEEDAAHAESTVNLTETLTEIHCVIPIHVDREQSVILGQTDLERQDLSAHAHEVTLAMLLWLVDEENVLVTLSAQTTRDVLTTNAKIPARVLIHPVVIMLNAR